MENIKPLSVLVTAGGTREDIDTVRSIANHSTGRLGSRIADIFYKNGAEVTFLCGEVLQGVMPRAHETVKIRSVAQLAEKLKYLLKKNTYDCVIHAMAVSDYTPYNTVDVNELTDSIIKGIYGQSLSQEEMRLRIIDTITARSTVFDKKISSKSPYLALILEQTPKVIGMIKELQPKTLLVGFKLLSGATERELTDAGLKLIKSCGCDYVVANDLSEISGDTHRALLIDKSGIIREAGTKSEVALMVYECVKKGLVE